METLGADPGGGAKPVGRMSVRSIVGVVLPLAAAAPALVVAGEAGTPARTMPPVAASQQPIPADDRTFRPTVIIRRGVAQGSGTIIASLEGETLVLTAAHVIGEGQGTIEVELHRYNVGLERFSRLAGGWPYAYPATVVATDRAADLAVVRVGGLKRLPYVARLTPGIEEAGRGTVVTSVGIDLGAHLSSWPAYIVRIDWFLLEDQDEERPFLITTRPPEHGRSGGGLFLPGGELAGVCIGRVEHDGRDSPQRRVGVFASAASVRRLLRDHDLEATLARSEALGRRSDGN
jgi:S1-C subfamily serine protease